jgi:hypothetical protein
MYARVRTVHSRKDLRPRRKAAMVRQKIVCGCLRHETEATTCLRPTFCRAEPFAFRPAESGSELKLRTCG